MTELVLFVLGSIGFTMIMVGSTIMNTPREWAKKKFPFIGGVFDCYQCMGWWTGLVSFFILFNMSPYVGLLGWSLGFMGYLFKAVIAGCASSFLSVLTMTYLNYLEARTIVNLGDDNGK